MAVPRDQLDAIVFMKVGRHAGEDFEEIIARKRKEYEATGMIFWGYGGGTLHPIHRVQPFARMKIVDGQRITLLMQEIVSKHPDTEVYATEYSRDGESWEPIPEGIRVAGSRYALVLDEIEAGDLNIDLGEYRVGAGPSAGRVGSQYIRGRVDKGCLERTGRPNEPGQSQIVRVNHFARLKEPFAVILRNDTPNDR